MRYRDTRLPSDKELKVEYGDHLSRAELVNISTTGARLKLLARPPDNALVALCLLHLRFPARVVWSDDVLTGVRFARPLSTTDLNALRGAGGDSGTRGSSSQHGFRELS